MSCALFTEESYKNLYIKESFLMNLIYIIAQLQVEIFTMFPKLDNPLHIISFVIHLIIGIGTIGNILFGTVWFVYFLFRIKVLSKKVYYLEKQTDERCFDALNNAKVDYIKSIFIAAISLSEVVFHLGFVAVLLQVFHKLGISVFKDLPNCTSKYELHFIKLSHQSQAYRASYALIFTSITILISLIHILTSYLFHAYSEKRITNIMRRERVMFAWLFIQLVCVWCSIFYWPLFMLTFPIMTVIALIGHLCLYWKYGRELHSVIRRRERDALFEDVQTHNKLFGMLKDYKNDAILYFVYIFLFTIGFIIIFSGCIIKILLFGDCLIEKYFHLKVQILHKEEKFPKIGTTMGLLLLLIATFPLLLIHLSILRKLIVRMFRKRAVMNKPTRFSRSTLYQPLIGNK